MTTPPSPEAVEAALNWIKGEILKPGQLDYIAAKQHADETKDEAAARILAAEVERLNKMRKHCDNCGADYLATGVEAGCPCLIKQSRDTWKLSCDEADNDVLRLKTEVERLRARVAELEDELQRRHTEYSKALNRRCTVEDALYDVAAGKRDLLTREECRALAIKLGVPPAEPITKKINA